jgi:hypothetical protein
LSVWLVAPAGSYFTVGLVKLNSGWMQVVTFLQGSFTGSVVLVVVEFAVVEFAVV